VQQDAATVDDADEVGSLRGGKSLDHRVAQRLESRDRLSFERPAARFI
jgi:hypothetical protein